MNSTCHLLSLPNELRDEIIDFVLRSYNTIPSDILSFNRNDEEPQLGCRCSRPKPHKIYPSAGLLSTNRQLRRETQRRLKVPLPTSNHYKISINILTPTTFLPTWTYAPQRPPFPISELSLTFHLPYAQSTRFLDTVWALLFRPDPSPPPIPEDLQAEQPWDFDPYPETPFTALLHFLLQTCTPLTPAPPSHPLPNLTINIHIPLPAALLTQIHQMPSYSALRDALGHTHTSPSGQRRWQQEPGERVSMVRSWVGGLVTRFLFEEERVGFPWMGSVYLGRGYEFAVLRGVKFAVWVDGEKVGLWAACEKAGVEGPDAFD